MLKNSRSTSSYRATEWRDMSFVDLLFLKDRENAAQIFEYIFSRSERFQFKPLLLGEVPVDNILSNVGWRPKTRNSLLP